MDTPNMSEPGSQPPANTPPPGESLTPAGGQVEASQDLAESRAKVIPAEDESRAELIPAAGEPFQTNLRGKSAEADDDADPEYEIGDESEAQVHEDEGEGAMTLVEHLSELRDRLLRSIVYIFISFMVSLTFGKNIIEFLEVPAGDMKFQALSIEEPVMVYFKVAFFAALVLASPFILLEVARFVAPGLTRREKQIVTPALVGGPVLFVAGAGFAYYFVLPAMFRFFTSFGQGISPINQRLDFYVSLVSTIMLYMGLCFQLPIVIFALSFTGLVTSDQLIKFWRYAVFGASVIALVITPDPTAFSMFMVMGALIGLYAVSVVLLKLFGR